MHGVDCLPVQRTRCARSASYRLRSTVASSLVDAATLFLKIVERHGLHIHAYADDIQVYGFCAPSMKNDLSDRLSACLDSLIDWFSSNRLRLNITKTDYMWCASKRRHQTVTFDHIRIGSLFPPPAPHVKCLGVLLDSAVSLIPQVSKTISSCFASLRQIRSIRRSLTTPLLITLVQSLVLPRLDYCISVFSGLPGVQIRRLQAVLHASARMIFSSSRFCHVTPLLRSLKWLPIEARIQFRLAALVHRCMQGKAPTYLREVLVPISRVAARSRLRSSSTSALAVPFVRRSTIGGRSFPVAAARVWNALPQQIQDQACHGTFKRLLKEYLLTSLCS